MLAKIKHYLELVRFSHTLFALPFAIGSMFYAAEGLPKLTVFISILICMVSARNVAMAFNRLVDAKYDINNPRTAKRHLPAGILSKTQVIAFVLINSFVFIASTYFLNSLAFYLSVPTLLVLMSYSFWKRFSWGCHLFLGFAIGISPMGAWVAVKGEIAVIPMFLCFMLSLWIAGFDIIYATADAEADKSEGLYSIPVIFGEKKSVIIAFILHLIMLITAVALGFYAQMGIFWWISFVLMVLIIFYINFLRKSASLDSLNADFFIANILISSLVMVSLILEVFV